MNSCEAEVAACEQRLPAWTRELLVCLTLREREAFVLRETGLTFDEVGARLDVTRERARALVEEATTKLTDAARRGALLHLRIPTVESHRRPKCICERCCVPEVMRGALDLPISALNLGLRAQHALEGRGILLLGDLVRCNVSDLLHTRTLGRSTLKAITEALAALGLHTAMDVGDWRAPPRADLPSAGPKTAP